MLVELVVLIMMFDLVGVDSNPADCMPVPADVDAGGCDEAALAVMILDNPTGLPVLLNCVLIGCCSLDFVDAGLNCAAPPTSGILDPGDVFC